MKKGYAALVTAVFMVSAAAVFLVAGCGGGGGNPGVFSVSGQLEIPGTTTGASRAASAMAPATGTVQMVIVTGTGTETVVAGPVATDAAGNYSLTVNSAYSYVTNDLVAKATVTTPGGATATLRANVYATTADIDPVTEAAYQIIVDKLVAEGKTFSDLTSAEVNNVVSAVQAAVGTSVDSLNDSLETIINNAKSIATFDSAVQLALLNAVKDPDADIDYIVMANTPSGWTETTGDFAYMELTGSDTVAPAANYNFLSPNPIKSDVAVAIGETYVYVMNRYGFDSVVVLDPASGFSVVANYSLKDDPEGDTLNPQDIEVISSTKAYVTLYEKDYMLVINPVTGEQTGTISLAAYTEQFGSGETLDAIPEAYQMAAAGDKVFVTVQNLDRASYWATTDYAKVVVIDTTTDTPVQGIDLATGCGHNPNGNIIYANSRIYLTCGGNTFNPTGTEPAGIASIDPSTYAVTNIASKADGDFSCSPSGVAIASATKGYFACLATWPSSSVYSFNPSTGDVDTTAVFSGSMGFSIGIDPDGNLVLPSRDTTDPGLVFIDTDTDQQLYGGAVDVGLMPEAFDFFTYTP